MAFVNNASCWYTSASWFYYSAVWKLILNFVKCPSVTSESSFNLLLPIAGDM